MTPGEARAWLEVDEATSPDAVRRAYLRKVKEHKPERDPEGFRRTREAYECLTRGAPILVRASDGAPGAGAPDEGPYRVPSPPEPEADDPFWSLLEALDEEEDPDERIATLRAAALERPDDVRVVLELERELSEADEPELAVEVLREAGARGLAGVDPILFRCHLERLNDEELARLETSPLPDAPRLRALALVLASRPNEAVALAEHALRGDGPPSAWLELVFSLYEHRARPQARAVLGAIQKRVAERGEGMRLPTHVQLSLLLASQLSQVDRRLDDGVLAIIARGLGTGALGDARENLLALRRREPHACWEAAKLLRSDAPALAQQFGTVLADDDEKPIRAAGRPPFWALFMVLPLLRVCASIMHAPDTSSAYHRPSTYDVTPASHGHRDRDRADVSEGSDLPVASPVSALRPDEGGPMVGCVVDPYACQRLATASRALDAHDCDRAAAGLRSFDRLVGAAEGVIADLRDRLDVRYARVCDASASDAADERAPIEASARPGDARWGGEEDARWGGNAHWDDTVLADDDATETAP